ncbi:TfoX/Sxy family protein [Pelomonas sp. SE-A7]|uniref:TfoX/Sxy family protein n=1 Tax=Pelomonas sp. SE-A7 TaxID=3054953 RepID=UPI00259CC06A|nr:TfoX/Sxy family protein [Pelomonas sp. SE-A7]MDM4766703.1 TfoX/Sxy family protein [Pelomonas sp. SE-A7]
MKNSPEFIAHCVELLQPLGPVRSRRMFGGHGLYLDDFFVAIVDEDQLFLKADELSRPRFEAEQCLPFSFEKTGTGEVVSMSYFRPPEEALESPALMQPWARLALDAALRAAQAKKPKARKKKDA